MHTIQEETYPLTEEEYAALLRWIRANFIPINTFNNDVTSYTIAHIFQYHPDGFYVGNANIKTAMLECGFQARSKKNFELGI